MSLTKIDLLYKHTSSEWEKIRSTCAPSNVGKNTISDRLLKLVGTARTSEGCVPFREEVQIAPSQEVLSDVNLLSYHLPFRILWKDSVVQEHSVVQVFLY